MVIAQLTHLNISIPASGMPPGQVPAECFPGGGGGGASTWELPSSRRVSFACDVTVLGRTPAPIHPPDIVFGEPSDTSVMKDDDIAMGAVATDTSAAVVPPPTGHREFSWPWDDWMVGSETSSDTTVEVFCGGSPCKDAGLPVDPHHCRCHLSSWIVRTIRWLLRWDRQEKSGVFCRGSSDLAAADAALLADSPLPSAEFLLQDLQWAPAAPRPQDVIEGGDSRSSSRVPRRLAREGIFLSEWSTSILCAFGAGCAFRRTTYRVSDHIWPSGAFGIPLNHPQFLEWVGVPESPSLLEIGPGQWLDTLSRDQAMAAAIQLHRDVCLMTKNLDIIDQYALSNGASGVLVALGRLDGGQ